MRTFHLLKYLKEQGHKVSLATLRTYRFVSDEEVAALEEWVEELAVFPCMPDPDQTSGKLGQVKRLATFAISGEPPSVRTSRSEKMQAWVDEKIASGQFDVITCEHCVNEAYVPEDIQKYIPTAVVNIHSSVYGTCAHQLAAGMAEKPMRDRINLPLLKRYEHRYCQKFSHLVVTTAEDQQQIAEISGKDSIHVIPNGVDLAAFAPRSQDPGGHKLVFIGAMDNLPNIDAVTYFAKDVFPLVRQKYPDATLSLVGSRPTSAVKALADLPNVVVTGRVPEMTPYLHEATVCVVPMRTGYGIKNKTLEAMAAGIPVVASDRGLEGLDVDGDATPTRALRAKTPSDYVEAIGRLFESSDLRQTLSKNGRELIEQRYTWAIAGSQYEKVLMQEAV